MLWGKYADDLVKAFIASAESKDVSVVKEKKNPTPLGLKAKRERRVQLHRVVNAVIFSLLDVGCLLRLCQQSF